MMNFQKFTLTSKIDDNDMMVLDIDLDTLDDDEPTVNLVHESLDRGEDGLCPHSQEFVDDYDDDDLFLQCIADMASEPQVKRIERVKYVIEMGDWDETMR